MADYDVIVIGSGGGGITAAALLAKQGRKTLVLEQAPRVGGGVPTTIASGLIAARLIELYET
jgi:phytoene dehydrogenase-like protein